MEDDTTSQAEEPESRAGSPLLRTEARLGAAWVSVTKLSPEFPPPGPGPSRVSDTDSREAHAVIISVSCLPDSFCLAPFTPRNIAPDVRLESVITCDQDVE